MSQPSVTLERVKAMMSALANHTAKPELKAWINVAKDYIFTAIEKKSDALPSQKLYEAHIALAGVMIWCLAHYQGETGYLYSIDEIKQEINPKITLSLNQKQNAPAFLEALAAGELAFSEQLQFLTSPSCQALVTLLVGDQPKFSTYAKVMSIPLADDSSLLKGIEQTIAEYKGKASTPSFVLTHFHQQQTLNNNFDEIIAPVQKKAQLLKGTSNKYQDLIDALTTLKKSTLSNHDNYNFYFSNEECNKLIKRTRILTEKCLDNTLKKEDVDNYEKATQRYCQNSVEVGNGIKILLGVFLGIIAGSFIGFALGNVPGAVVGGLVGGIAGGIGACGLSEGYSMWQKSREPIVQVTTAARKFTPS